MIVTKTNLFFFFRSIVTKAFLCLCFQIPDIKAGKDRVDAVVVDEESVGSVNAPGCGGKILRGDGALDRYLAETKLKDLVVSSDS